MILYQGSSKDKLYPIGTNPIKLISACESFPINLIFLSGHKLLFSTFESQDPN